ncbi:MAG: hypothetical protein ABL962_18035 [Fimbriimonadaceae bacterium]
MYKFFALLMAWGCASTMVFAQLGGGGPGGDLMSLPDWNLLSRDYLGNVRSTDRFWDDWPQVDSHTLHPVVEIPVPLGAPAFVGTTYVRSGGESSNDIKLKFKWRNDVGAALNGSIVCVDAKLDIGVPGVADYGLTLTCDLSTFSVAPGGIVEATFTAASLPSYVTWGKLKLYFHVYLSFAPAGAPWQYDNGARPLTAYENIYVVDQAPISYQLNPWIDLLEHACTWAHGRFGQESVCKALTQGFYDDIWIYDPAISGGYWITPTGQTPFASSIFYYKLGKLLNDIATGDKQLAQCDDVNGALALASCGVGHAAKCILTKDAGMNFYTPPDRTEGTGLWSNTVLPAGALGARKHSDSFFTSSPKLQAWRMTAQPRI